MMAATCIRIIQVVVGVLLCVSDGDGQLLGHPAPRTLQEFLGVPQEFQEFPARYGARHLTEGYGTPKPYVPIVKTVISDAAGSSVHGGGNVVQSTVFSGDIQGRSPDEFQFNEISTEHEDENNDGKNLGQDYQLLKESAVKGLNKNAYGFKHNPKKFRNPQEDESSQKTSDGLGRPFEGSSDGFSLRENTDSSAGFFSQPDWRDWPQDGAGQAGDHGDHPDHADATDAGERGTGFPPGGHFREQYTVEDGHARPEGDGHLGETKQTRQSHVSRDRQQTLREFGAMVSFDASRARGAGQDSNHLGSSGQDNNHLVSRGHDSNLLVSRGQDSYPPLNGHTVRTDTGPTQQHVGVARDFSDHKQEFGRPKELTESAELNSNSERDSHRGEFEFERVPGNSGYSISEDTGRQSPSAWGESLSSSDFASGLQHGGPSVSSVPGPSVSYSSSPAEDWRGEDGRVRDVSSFEPQRTTAQPKREGYNTPKPYRPPQPQHLPPQTTTPPPWRGAGPLGRPQYGPGLSAGPYGPFQDADAPYGPSQDAAGLYGSSQHSLLGLSAARHAPGYNQPYRDVQGYTDYQRGYPGYRHGYQSTPLPYAAAVVHTDQHYHAVPVYPSGHEARGTAGYAAGGYPHRDAYPPEYGSEYRAGYGRGTGDGRGPLQGVQLYQITQPVLPQYGATEDHRINAAHDHGEHYGTPPSNYGTAGYGTAGYGSPGYVSLEYVPAGHPGGYGLKRPAYSSVYYSTRDYGSHGYGYGSHGEYGVPEVGRYEGYNNRPYRRADEAGGQQPAASETVETVAAASGTVETVAAASEPVESVAAASEPVETVAAASETVETVAANPESVTELAKPVDVDVVPEEKVELMGPRAKEGIK